VPRQVVVLPVVRPQPAAERRAGERESTLAAVLRREVVVPAARPQPAVRRMVLLPRAAAVKAGRRPASARMVALFSQLEFPGRPVLSRPAAAALAALLPRAAAVKATVRPALARTVVLPSQQGFPGRTVSLALLRQVVSSAWPEQRVVQSAPQVSRLRPD
jgi:hypothetical protein